MAWTAEITNDPQRDYELYVEILEDDQFVARLQYSTDGYLELKFYGKAAVIPFDWLREIAKKFEKDREMITRASESDPPI